MKLTFHVCCHVPSEGKPSGDQIKMHMEKLKAHLEAGGYELAAPNFFSHERMFYESLRSEFQIQNNARHQPGMDRERAVDFLWDRFPGLGSHVDSAEMPKGRPIAVARGEPFVSPTVEWHKLSEFAKSKSAKDLEPLKEAIDEFQQRFPTDE
jgi:hypothetical protein